MNLLNKHNILYDPAATRECIGNLAVVTTILQFLSGILICRQFVVNQTTGEASALPFLTCILSSLLWLFYGHIKGDDKIVLVNVVGVILMSIYTVVFYIYSMKKSTVKKQTLITSLILFLIMAYLNTEENTVRLLKDLGIFATICTLITIAAPMSKLMHVIRVKNTECLPFPLILMSFIVTTLWALYGGLSHDFFLVVVNTTGAFLATAQLMLFVIYPNTPVSPLIRKTNNV